MRPMPSAQPAIQLRGVVKRFGEITAVDHFDLDVPEGACVGLLGPNGAGKSTLIKSLLGFIVPEHGTLRVLGFPVADRPRSPAPARRERVPPATASPA